MPSSRAGQNIRLVFKAATYNNTTDVDGDEAVRVSSSRTRAGIPLRLTEQTATGIANKTVGLYSATFIVSDTQPDDYVDGGGYSTFDEMGVGVDLDGSGNDGRRRRQRGVAFYAAAYPMFGDGNVCTLTGQTAHADNVGH